MNSRITGVLANIALPLLATIFLAACASSPDTPDYLAAGDYRDRVQTQQASDITVSAAVPSATETREIFNQDLYRKKIQPVWLEIHNGRDEPVTFLPAGLDPQYFSPLEAANIDLSDGSSVTTESLVDRFFLDQSMSLVLLPDEKISGFIFTRLDEGTKAFNVDLSWTGTFETFTFFIPVPGLAIDHYAVDWNSLYPADEIVEVDEATLVELAESFACCVTDKSGENNGDPLNLVLIGNPIDLYVAFIRAGWDETEVVTRASAWKTMRSFLSGGEYRYSPVSSLYVFGRPQDVAFQKARDNIHERNHLRLWMTRARFQGYPVWIGQISRDIGVRFTRKTITTHKIDPDVDETREYLLEDLAYSQALAGVGYVRGVGEVSRDAPQGNLTGDPWYSDGYRLVLWVTSEPTPISDVEFLPFRRPNQDSESP